MDRDDLAARIDSYMHRYGALDADILTFIADARSMIAQDLRTQHNLTSATVAMTGGTGTLPADFEAVQTVYEPAGGRLEYVTADFAASWREETDTPTMYTIDTGLRSYPLTDGNYTLYYYQLPTELTAGGTENTVLTRLPLVYLSACLYLGGIWTASPEFLQAMLDFYQREIGKANAAYKRSRRGHEAAQQGTHSFAANPPKGV